MFDLHNTLNEFYADHVQLDSDETKKLKDYRDINLGRLKSGLDKLGEEHDTIYAHYQYYRNQGSYAMYTINQHPDNEYDIDIAIVFKKDDLPNSALGARQRIADAFKKVAGNFSQDPEADPMRLRFGMLKVIILISLSIERMRRYLAEQLLNMPGRSGPKEIRWK